MQKLNIHQELLKERAKNTDSNQLSEVLKKIWVESDLKSTNIKETLNSKNDNSYNSLDFDKMDSNKIFHEKTIEKICVDYRLRFLDTNYFKGEYPDDLNRIVLNIENKHNTILKNFKIIAPSKLFKLRSPDDPLLFVPIGNGYYYLIHKWGNEMKKFRKLLVLPFKNLNNLLIFSIIFSALFTAGGKMIFNTMTDAEVFTLFLFAVKSFVFIFFYLFFLVGKNFNQTIWNSRFTSF
ncbi:hypothetical protein N9373_00125 [Flavobacteriaceae bacterium]|nr:hypothetical protein [Flavobacteriaceae bacterium]